MNRKNTIGIITLGEGYLFHNYGTFFQHLSLRKYVESLGYICRRIPRLGEKTSILFEMSRIVRRFISITWHVFRGRAKFVEEIRSFFSYVRQSILFRTAYKDLLGGVLGDIVIDKCEGVIIGGDQVWGGIDNMQFGMGRRNGSKLFSYAVSADWLRVSMNSVWLESAKKELNDFVAVSVREDAGVNLINERVCLDKEVTRVCDPVFLSEKNFYLDIVSNKKIFSTPTLLCYILNIRSADDFSIEYYKRIADELGVKLVFIGSQGAERYINMNWQRTPSPYDFIRMIRDAEYIITNSFHGVCFSLLFEKKFVCLKQKEQDSTASQNVRSQELLGRLNLNERILGVDYRVESVVEMLKASIDYRNIIIALRAERESSSEKLSRWLQ
jgi:hypothetical protein